LSSLGREKVASFIQSMWDSIIYMLWIRSRAREKDPRHSFTVTAVEHFFSPPFSHSSFVYARARLTSCTISIKTLTRERRAAVSGANCSIVSRATWFLNAWLPGPRHPRVGKLNPRRFRLYINPVANGERRVMEQRARAPVAQKRKTRYRVCRNRASEQIYTSLRYNDLWVTFLI